MIMQNKPVRPALAAAQIWSTVALTGPLFFLLLNWLQQRFGNKIFAHIAIQPDYLDLYSTLLITGFFLSIVPFFITWALLAAWKHNRLTARLMGERLFLLTLLFTVISILFLMDKIETQHPIKNAALLLVPYAIAGILGIIRALGWPWRSIE